MEEITITIPAQPFSHRIYADNNDCYIARELKKLGFNNIKVSGFGVTRIDGVKYVPTKGFNSVTLELTINKGKSYTLVLRKEE